MYDLASWPRFLATGANAAWSFAANGQLQRLHDKGKDSSLAVLVTEAWRKVADDAAESRLNR